MKKALMIASVASMIDLFNMDNIKILKELGYEVSVACNFDEGNITSDKRIEEFKRILGTHNVKYYNIPIPRDIKLVKQIKIAERMVTQLLQEEQFNIVHCHSPIGGVIARRASKPFRKSGTKLIYTAHGFHFYEGAPFINWLLFYPIEKYYSRYTDILITINNEDYIRGKKFQAKNCFFVPGIGINVESIKQQMNREASRKELNIKKDEFCLISVGQLSKRKNHEVIIKALAKINDKNIKYVICGLGELEMSLRKLSEELNVEDQVIFTGYRSDIFYLLSASDCFIFPSLQEGLPVSLMEAMAVGLPVIASKIRGNTDLVVPEKGGILTDNSIDQYEKSIKRIKASKTLQKNFSAFNKQTVEKFDINNINSKMYEIYSSLE